MIGPHSSSSTTGHIPHRLMDLPSNPQQRRGHSPPSGPGGSEVKSCPRPHSHSGVELDLHQIFCFPPKGLSSDH